MEQLVAVWPHRSAANVLRSYPRTNVWRPSKSGVKQAFAKELDGPNVALKTLRGGKFDAEAVASVWPVPARVLEPHRERHRPHRHEVATRVETNVGEHQAAQRGLDVQANTVPEDWTSRTEDRRISHVRRLHLSQVDNRSTRKLQRDVADKLA